MVFKNLKHNQDGLVSFVVTILVMLILSLIVLGFARQSTREQRQALDSQLSTQAFYAAEAGVADATQALRNGSVSNKTDCSPLPGFNNNLNSNVSYSCVLIDSTPVTAEYQNVGTSPIVVPIISNTNQPLSQIRIWWHDTGGAANNQFNRCPDNTSDTFPDQWHADCNAGLLRVDLVPYTSSNSRSNLINRQMTIFVRPNDEGSPASVAYAGGLLAQGGVFQTECDNTVSASNPRLCGVTITGLTAVSSPRWYARISSIYRSSDVLVEMTDTGGGTEMRGNQAVVDVTGKASDILRRIQVRVPIFESINPSSQFVSQTNSTLCKRLTVVGNQASVDGTYPDPSCQVN